MTTTENQSMHAQETLTSKARAQKVTAVSWLTGVTAVVALGVLSEGASAGMALGVAAVSGMVAMVSHRILKEP